MSNRPPIPNMPPLSSVQDENVRVALESLWNGWRVRNGEVGDGEHKFLTVADLKEGLNQTVVLRGSGGTLSGVSTGGVAPPNTSWVKPLLDRIDDYIQQSWLWKKLGERIDWIDTPEWFQGKFGAAIKTETIERQTATSALASQITTAVTNINGNLALARDEIKTVSDLAGATASRVTTLQTEVAGVKITAENAFFLSQTIDGNIKGAWTVKFDANGYVAGAGLGLEGKNGTLRSAFYVRADSFAIGNPQYPGIPPKTPFKVFTTTTSLPDGSLVPPGVYMDEAVVYKLTGTYIDAGTLNAAEIYTGSTWLDRYSGYPILSQATGNFRLPGEGHYALSPRTSGEVRFYSPGHHPWVPIGQRVRGSQWGGNVTFIVTASASVDHYFSIWYRINDGGWGFIGKVIEYQNDFGTAAVAGAVTLYVPNSPWYVDFGMAVINENGEWTSYDGKNQYIRDGSLVVSAVNV